MIPIEELKHQHEEICELMTVLLPLVSDDAARKTSIVEQLFAELTDKIGKHLLLEDETLYKELLVHHDTEIQRTARNFLAGSNQLKHVFTEYMHSPCGPASKEKDCEAFIRETEDMFGLLKERIEKEESRFYPLVQA